jgi:hypothetical protein
MNIKLNTDNVLAYSVINGRLKVFVNKGTISELQNNTEQPQNDTPNSSSEEVKN